MIGAIDIGGTKIAAGIVGPDGTVLAHSETPTRETGSFEAAADRMAEMIRKAAAQTGAGLDGIGIGCTGPVDPITGRIGHVEFLLDWEGKNLVEALTERMNVPVVLENDADAAALGEWTWGAGQNLDPFLLVTVGTGIGVGIIAGGKLYRGVNGAHPEPGHQILNPAAPACYCGLPGCWESLSSGPALETWYQANHPDHVRVAGRRICELAHAGDSLAIAAVQRSAHYLGLGIVNLINIFAPAGIALGGGLMQSYDLFLGEIEQCVRTYCTQVPVDSLEIVPARLGARTGLIGAARTWTHRFGAVGQPGIQP